MNPLEISKGLFGRPCRLPLAIWILRHDRPFYQSQPPGFGASASSVTQELERFESLGMLRRTEQEEPRRVWFEMAPSPLWEIIRTAAGVIHSPR